MLDLFQQRLPDKIMKRFLLFIPLYIIIGQIFGKEYDLQFLSACVGNTEKQKMLLSFVFHPKAIEYSVVGCWIFFCSSLVLFQCNLFFAGVPHTQSQCCTMAWEKCWYKLMDREQITGYVNCKNLDKSVCSKVVVVVTYSVLNSSNFFSTRSEH